jgi:hypothetical protein
MWHIRCLLMGLILLASGRFAVGQDSVLDLCELLNRPQAFDGKQVSVRASYRYGFEWEEVYCLQCRHLAKVWLAIPPELPKAVQRSLNRLPKNQGTINATLTGVFHGSRSAFGDGGYQYQLDLERLEQVEVVSKSGAVPEALRASERTKVCHGRLQAPTQDGKIASELKKP